jgi:hypothetical protein
LITWPDPQCAIGGEENDAKPANGIPVLLWCPTVQTPRVLNAPANCESASGRRLVLTVSCISLRPCFIPTDNK